MSRWLDLAVLASEGPAPVREIGPDGPAVLFTNPTSFLSPMTGGPL